MPPRSPLPMRFVVVTILLLLVPAGALSDDLSWAYPVTPRPGPLDNLALKHVPGSAKAYTQAQIDDPFNPPDWFPDEHPPMPVIVAQGQKPLVQACAYCHSTTGEGYPQTAGLAGLSSAYLSRQMAEFRTGGRKGVLAAPMIAIAHAISEPDNLAASDYFAALSPTILRKVIESDVVPKSHVGAGGMRFAEPDGGTEAVGNRIIVLPQDEARTSSRDPHSGFVDYVPPGSVARGQALVVSGASKTLPCAPCHARDLKGFADVPPIAGRAPIYTVRQLNDMKIGLRSGGAVAQMEAVVEKLAIQDMIAIAAYLGTREP
jgi:cytochrome c553